MPKTIAPREAIPAMTSAAGVTDYALSKRMGKTPNWAWNMKRFDTKLSTLAKIAEVLGLKVAILGKDDEVVAVIEPEAEDGAS